MPFALLSIMKSNLNQKLLKRPEKLLAVVLGLTALHSFAMGLALIAQPPPFMEIIGFVGRANAFSLSRVVSFTF
jgi:hypothetical protein